MAPRWLGGGRDTSPMVIEGFGYVFGHQKGLAAFIPDPPQLFTVTQRNHELVNLHSPFFRVPGAWLLLSQKAFQFLEVNKAGSILQLFLVACHKYGIGTGFGDRVMSPGHQVGMALPANPIPGGGEEQSQDVSALGGGGQ